MSDSYREYKIGLDISPVPIMLVAPDGVIRRTNRTLDDLFGYKEGELEGQLVEVLVPEEVRPVHPELRDAYFTVPTTRRMGTGRDLSGIRKDGEKLPVEIGLEPVEFDGEAMVIVSVIDIRERKATESRLRRALNAAACAMIEVGPDGKIVLVNEETSELFDYSEEELIGQPIEMLIPESRRIKHRVYRTSYQAKPVRRSMGSGRELRGRRRDGSEFPVEIGLTPIISPEGVTTLASVNDVTETRQSERLIRQKNTELSRLNEELTEFAYSASHDLKSPLVTIVGMLKFAIEDLSANDLTEVQKNVAMAHEAAETLSKRIEDMLTLAKADSLNGEFDELRVRDCIEETWRILSLGGAGTSPTLTTALNHDDPIVTVPARFAAIVENLLGNAIKYQHPDRADGSVHVETWDDDGNFRLSVKDNGIGIPADQHHKVFGLFQRFSKGDAPGTGLGLALVKKYVKLLGGSITFSSGNEGSVFSVSLPRGESRDEQLETTIVEAAT